MKKYLILFVFMTSTIRTFVDITIEPFFGSRAVDATVSSHMGAGFFCEFGKVISNLIYYEEDKIRSIYVDWTHQFFPFKDKPHENGWDLYFEPITTEFSTLDATEPIYKVGHCNSHELHDQTCVAHWLRYDDYLPYRQFVHAIINKYIRIKPHILEQVELFYQHHMKDHLCIGVHVRYAVAHGPEAPKGHPPLEDYCKEVDTIMNAHPESTIKIFLASDSHAVINYFKARYNNQLVYIETYRAEEKEDPGLIYENEGFWTSHVAAWHHAKPGYQGGVGVLIDCLLLSKCDYFIHITSNVASYVCFFNPTIQSIYLPHNILFEHCRSRGNPAIRNKFLNPI